MNHTTEISWLERFFRFRPRFMDIDRIVPSWGEEDENVEEEEEVWDGDHDNESSRSRSRSRSRQVRHRRSTFPIRDDVGYIGCLSDDEDDIDNEESKEIMVLRRREILFKNTVFVILGFVVFFILLGSLTWWGYRPPTAELRSINHRGVPPPNGGTTFYKP